MSDNQAEKISQRLKMARKSLGLNQGDFAKGAKIMQSQVSEIENDKRNITSTILIALEDAYLINRKWLEKGEGEMFLAEKPKANAKAIGQINYPLEPEETPFIDLGEGQYLMVMPLVSEYAHAGYLNGYADPEYIEELPKHTIVVNKHHKGHYLGFETVGDSMNDGTIESIPDGSIVTGREIQQHYWTSKFHTHRYKDYVIIHKTEGITTKRIIFHDVEKGIIKCHSLNPDKVTYPDFELSLNDVKRMFNIVNVSIPR